MHVLLQLPFKIVYLNIRSLGTYDLLIGLNLFWAAPTRRDMTVCGSDFRQSGWIREAPNQGQSVWTRKCQILLIRW